MTKVLTGTKAETLEFLAPRVRHARILPQVWFTAEAWRDSAADIVGGIVRQWPDLPLAVRSSASDEDRAGSSQAGRYTSVLGARGAEEIVAAVSTVLASYGTPCAADQILVQPLLENVELAGVAFSVDPATCAPYRVVNFTVGNDTTRITSGHDAGHTLVRAASATEPPPQGFATLFDCIAELELILPGMPLDIEFAIAGGVLYLLQVRPLHVDGPVTSLDSHREVLLQVQRKIAAGMTAHPFLHGRRTVYGVMPDWNPAEIIGIRPRPLALSLYRDLVTDSIWAYQRNNYGYRNLRSFPLLVHFFGLPYIDVRVSFNSFIPRDIEGSLADRLVDHYIDRLVSAPNLHDKVEFEIVLSCYSLDLPARLDRLREAGFTDDECASLSDSLRRLTNRIIHHKTGLWREDAARLETLSQRREEILSSGTDTVSRIYWLLEDCKRYGTLPFAGLARAGFVAVQMLRSMIAVGVLSKGDYDSFMLSLNTVSGKLSTDFASLDRVTFLAHYGHLRPGTYDILSPRYDEQPDLYFDWTHLGQRLPAHDKPAFALSLSQMREISALLREHGLEPDVVGLFDFLQAGIELREYAKFLFTRNLSDALSLIRAVGQQYGFTADEMSYCDLRTFQEMHASACDPGELIRRSVEQGVSRHAITRSIILPALVTSPDDVWSFMRGASEPNFVTQKRLIAEVTGHLDRERLAGRVICIPSADPGFDWLFAYPIAGLVTAYGGANSHMAIRANELGLPAVIGAGEMLYARWSGARALSIDCASRRVEVLS